MLPTITTTPALRLTASAAVLACLLFTTACTVQSDKGSGNGDNVKISTPLGGLRARTSDVDASTLGLPEYPGAHQLKKNEDNGDDGAVDLHMGFGPWQMRVKVVSYGTPDPQDKILAFYRKALSKYGDVIECNGNHPIGSPASTREGLSCDEHDGSGSTKWNGKDLHLGSGEVELKAGSPHRQHIVGIRKPEDNQTRFALIALELPDSHNSGQTN